MSTLAFAFGRATRQQNATRMNIGSSSTDATDAAGASACNCGSKETIATRGGCPPREARRVLALAGMMASPPNHKAEIAKKLMLILYHFKIIEFLTNIFNKIKLLGD